MNLREYLVTQLAEEAAEVSQACNKANRFGLHDNYKGKTDQSRILDELNDLFALVELLSEEAILPWVVRDEEAIAAKKEKVKKWMEHAKSLGTLTPCL